ncbi:MAG: type II secretion system protein [Candidatus Omnitrophota bacterium]
MKKNKAFTLIELMISSVILVVCLFSLITSFIMCYGLSETARNTTIATEDGRRVIEEMRSTSAESLVLVVNEDWSAWAAAHGCVNLEQEQILVTYTDRNGTGDPLDDDPLEVSVNVTWQERGRWRILNFNVLLTPR